MAKANNAAANATNETPATETQTSVRVSQGQGGTRQERKPNPLSGFSERDLLMQCLIPADWVKTPLSQIMDKARAISGVSFTTDQFVQKVNALRSKYKKAAEESKDSNFKKVAGKIVEKLPILSVSGGSRQRADGIVNSLIGSAEDLALLGIEVDETETANS